MRDALGADLAVDHAVSERARAAVDWIASFIWNATKECWLK